MSEKKAPVAVPMQSPELYSIVVLGAMNPRLHYPLWYQVTGSMTKEEANAARESPGFFVAPEFAQFETPQFIVTCIADRWEIKARSVAAQPKVLEIACRVFEKLGETPVTAYGFNSIRHLETKSPRVRDVLRQLAIGAGLG